MNTPFRTMIGKAGLCSLLLALLGCQPAPASGTTLTAVQPTLAATLSLRDTYAAELDASDFEAMHSPVDGDANEYLIFGNVPVLTPAADLPAEWTVFLGRWEGYNYGPPVKKDHKVVLVIQEMTEQGGRLVAWAGTNLQYPDMLYEIHFRVLAGESPTIEWQMTWPGGLSLLNRFTYDRSSDLLEGWAEQADGSWSGPFELHRERTFQVYKDYAQYLAGKRIYARTYQNSELAHYGQGYLVYLPEGYEDHPEADWPLIFFLHGYGDRGDNVFLLAKASPYMYIRDQGPLPFIIVAPLLGNYEGYSSFPEAYMDGVLAEVQAYYRVDPKRIYVTGLSMGGEATYRFALHRPDTFAAIAPLSAYLDHAGEQDMGSIRQLPVWAIHGAEDVTVPLDRAEEPVEALQAVGGNIRFTVLQGHDHDVWTDTYSDPAFYDWLLQYQKE